MLAYKYDKDTKEYKGTQQAQVDPINGGYLLPADSTFTPVPENVPAGYVYCYIDEVWTEVLDHRNQPQVNLTTLEITNVDYLGTAHQGYQFITEEVKQRFLEDKDRYKVIDGVFTDISDTEEYREIKRAKRETKFKKEFFETSLGWIRRRVTMQFSGETKDFLSDLLPTISMGLTAGQEVRIIAYNEPDYTQEVEDWTIYQHTEVVTAQFIQDCFLQLQADFGVINNIEEA